MLRVSRKLLGAGGLDKRYKTRSITWHFSYPANSSSVFGIRHTSSTAILYQNGDGAASLGDQLDQSVAHLKTIHPRIRSKGILRSAEHQIESPLGTFCLFQSQQHFVGDSCIRCTISSHISGSQSLWDDRTSWCRAPTIHGRPLYFSRSEFMHRRNHQQQAMSYFSSSSLKMADRDETSSVNEAASMVKVKPEAPRRHPNLLKPLEKTRVPTPNSAPESMDPLNQLSKTSTKGILRKGLDLMSAAFRAIVLFAVNLPGNILYFATRPTELNERLQGIWESVKHEANHYWVGTKLLWEEVKTARMLFGKTLDGTVLSRRERKQLLRTVSDLFRLVPFSMFILIPFMEFALPFALRLFPNMLPSTYQDSLKAEENMKRELKSRIAMAQFFQETLEELAKEQKRKASTRQQELEDAGVDTTQEEHVAAQQASAVSMLEFLEKARKGDSVPTEVIVKYATYFQDDLTLDNMPRMQLINMCRYMNIQPYGSDAFLRFQLRHKMRNIKEDDSSILWEGINTLTKMELREACRERGMRSTGLSKEAYKQSLQQWLDLSVSKDIPIALLIMSRIFFLREDVFEPRKDESETDLSGLADAISGLDNDIVNEAILEVATNAEKTSDPEVRKIKLKVLEQQNELIRKEEKEREAAAKKEAEREAAAKKEEEHLEKQTTDVKIASANEAKVDGQLPNAADRKPSTEVVEGEKEQGGKIEEEGSLSAEEMDAISQLWSDDPVSKERAELEKIKAAIKQELAERHVDDEGETEQIAQSKLIERIESGASTNSSGAMHVYSDENVKEVVDEAIKMVSKESSDATTISLDDHLKDETKKLDNKEATGEDPIVARLKKRVESMVDKIEVQLSETQVKIGDKLHFLDKDKDGIFTKDEIAEALQSVLKRKISVEEAVEIANNMDTNADGFLTVEEFVQWIDEHKLVKFVQEDRDADMDKIMEDHAASTKQEEDSTENEARK